MHSFTEFDDKIEPRELAQYLNFYHSESSSSPNQPIFRASYVERYSPWRATLQEDSYQAEVLLGTDPGTFYCGGMARYLAELGAILRIPTGFIHVPPDAEAIEGESLLLPTSVLISFMYRIVEQLVGSFFWSGSADLRKIFIWGFDTFGAIRRNPTQLFLQGDRGNTLEARGERQENAILITYLDVPGPLAVYPLVLPLAANSQDARCGNYLPSMEHVYRKAGQQVELFGKPDLILGLGVDAAQLNPIFTKPTFLIELQSQGFQSSVTGLIDPYFNEIPTINTDLISHWLLKC